MSINCDGISFELCCDKGRGKKKSNENNNKKCCPTNLKENICNELGKMGKTSAILENILDLASTLVNIMCIFGIHECKANKAIDVIIYAFMHFDEVAEYPGAKRKKRIRKEEFYFDLIRDCGLTKVEAKLTYAIVKYAFKAFYYKQDVNRYEPSRIDECSWNNAANQTISEFNKVKASKSETEIAGKRILSNYQNFVCRLKTKRQEKYIQQTQQRENKNDFDCFDFDFNATAATATDTCKPAGSEPPLCGQFCCQIECPPGSKQPQFVCKDPCGRTFMRVEGNKVNFDPFLMESEARRVANSMYPSCDMDRIRFLKQSLNICSYGDNDSCDEKLAEICKDGSISVICDDDDDEIDFLSEDGGVDGRNQGGRPGGVSTGREDGQSRRGEGQTGRGDGQTGRGDGQTGRGDGQTVRGDGQTRRGDGQTGRGEGKTGDSGRGDTSKQKSFSGNLMSVLARFQNSVDGYVMHVIIQGYCGSAPKDITFLKIRCNEDSPVEFSCTPIRPGTKGTKNLQKGRQSRILKLPKNATTCIHVKFLTSSKGRTMAVEMKGYGYNNGHVPQEIGVLKIYCNKSQSEYTCTPAAKSDAEAIEEPVPLPLDQPQDQPAYNPVQVEEEQAATETQVEDNKEAEDQAAPAGTAEENVEGGAGGGDAEAAATEAAEG